MNPLKLILPALAILLISNSGCQNNRNQLVEDCADVHWSYSGEVGPTHWVDLCSGFNACGGQTQSPVNITGAVEDQSLSPMVFNYSTTQVEIENNGHTIEFVCDPGSKLIISGTEYDLLQFHYHGLSEHEVDGSHYPLEVHFVHKATEEDYAVIGVFIEEGADNPLFTEFISHFPHDEGSYEDHETVIDLTSLFPENTSYYHYSGSLTTPPCSEVVNWYVLKNTVSASAAQIAEFQSILNNNYRPVQDLNGRVVSLFTE